MMSLESRRILLASLIEVKELWHELVASGQTNAADSVKPLIYERARRVENGQYFDGDYPATPPHSN